jgi:hypothetical protein
MLVNISLIVAATAAFSICYRLRRKELITKNLTFLLLSVVIFIYSSIIWQFRLGEEKIHFIEYGILGFLIYRAFCVDIKGVKAYIYTLLLGSVAGWVDEAIQHILPNRYYELKDVLMNTIGVAMGLIIIFIADLDKRPILKFYRKR